MKVTLLTLTLMTLFYSCSTPMTKLTEAGAKIEVIDNYKKKQCDVVDKVVGINDKGSKELARNHARNLAAEVGGDSIVFDETIQNGYEFKIHATVYRCEKN